MADSLLIKSHNSLFHKIRKAKLKLQQGILINLIIILQNPFQIFQSLQLTVQILKRIWMISSQNMKTHKQILKESSLMMIKMSMNFQTEQFIRVNGIKALFMEKEDFICKINHILNVIVFKTNLLVNGDYFEGFISHSQADGEGIYVMRRQKLRYEGNFQKNYLNGYAHESGPGYRFDGQYVNGIKKQGTLVWWNQAQFGQNEPKGENANKKCEYKGPFLDEKFHGFGVLKNKIGTFEGRFQNGVKKGFGKFIWNNGARFEGNYMNNLKNGEGKMHNPKGQVILQGRWIDDKPPVAIQAALKS